MIVSKQTINKLFTHCQDAFCEVYDCYHRIVHCTIYSMVRNNEVAKELVQDTFVKMWNNIHTFAINSNFSAWLLSIAKNTAKDYLRSCEPIVYVDNLECQSETSNLLNDLNIDANGILNPLEYQVIVLTVIYNFTRKDAAKFLDRPIGTVLRVYKQALDKLKKFYEVENLGRKKLKS